MKVAVLGVLARVNGADHARVSASLAAVHGVTPFSVDQPQRMGILLEGNSLDEVYSVLKDTIEAMPGILGTWPVFSHAEEETS